jgi:hypothetical protein
LIKSLDNAILNVLSARLAVDAGFISEILEERQGNMMVMEEYPIIG